MFTIFQRRRKYPGLDPRTPIAGAGYVAIDTELTGLDEKKDSIVSLGGIKMTGGRIELGSTLDRLVSPRTELRADTVVIHEITPSDVQAEPGIDAAMDEFLSFIGSRILVGHFISIDLEFLNREMKRTRGRELPNAAIDTCSIYDWLRKRAKAGERPAGPVEGCRLYDIAKCFDVPVCNAHNAVMDAYTTAQLFQRFLPLLKEGGVDDIDDLLRIGKPFKGGDSFRLTNEFGNF